MEDKEMMLMELIKKGSSQSYSLKELLISGPGDIMYPANINTLTIMKKQKFWKNMFLKLNTSNIGIVLGTDDE